MTRPRVIRAVASRAFGLALLAPLALVALLATPLPRAVAANAPAADADDVRLVLFITVDQLRGDVLPRWADRFGDGGFRLLLERGVHYRNAHFRHAATFTSAGHATLFTGGNVPEHGIAANVWRDHATGDRVYSVEDDRHVLLGETTAPHRGTSPRLLESSTIGDEMILASRGRSRVLSVSVKDRGAILPAGRLGQAYWFSRDTGRFVTSTYYRDAYPAWAQAWNDADPAAQYDQRQWTLLNDPATYVHADDDDRSFERPVGALGSLFPHVLHDHEDVSFERQLVYTPFGDELTLDFAFALIEHERPGQGDATDLLAVSFSSTDYIGHAYGPHSLEAEDNLMRLDRTIARLLARVDETVGLDRTIIVLSSDHGVDAATEYHQTLAERLVPGSSALPRANLIDAMSGRQSAPIVDRIDPADLMARANAVLRDRYDLDVDLVRQFWNPGLSLDEAAIRANELDQTEIERLVAETVVATPGIAVAVSRSDLLAGRVPDTYVMGMIKRSLHPVRSPHVFVIQAPFWHLYHRPDANAAMHGSPYAYDTHVPIVIVRPGTPPATVSRRVAPADIAPTLAQALDLSPPSGSTGTPLDEVLGTAPARTP